MRTGPSRPEGRRRAGGERRIAGEKPHLASWKAAILASLGHTKRGKFGARAFEIGEEGGREERTPPVVTVTANTAIIIVLLK